MVLRAPLVLGALLAVLAVLAAAAWLLTDSGGGERMVARAASRLSAATLRDCLGSRLGLAWHGDDRTGYAGSFGLRVVVSDSGQSRQVGLFTAGARPLSSSENGALEACLASK